MGICIELKIKILISKTWRKKGKLPFRDEGHLQSDRILRPLVGSQDQRPHFRFPTHLAGRKFTEKFRGAVGLAEVEVGWCGEYADLSPAVLSGNEGLEGPPVFRVCVQGLCEKEEGGNISVSRRVSVLNVTSRDDFPE